MLRLARRTSLLQSNFRSSSVVNFNLGSFYSSKSRFDPKREYPLGDRIRSVEDLNIRLSTCAHYNKPSSALNLLESAWKERVPFNHDSLIYTIYALVQNGQFSRAERVLEDYRKNERRTPPEFAYHYIMAGYARSGQFGSIQKLILQMRTAEVPESEKFYETLLHYAQAYFFYADRPHDIEKKVEFLRKLSVSSRSHSPPVNLNQTPMEEFDFKIITHFEGNQDVYPNSEVAISRGPDEPQIFVDGYLEPKYDQLLAESNGKPLNTVTHTLSGKYLTTNEESSESNVYLRCIKYLFADKQQKYNEPPQPYSNENHIDFISGNFGNEDVPIDSSRPDDVSSETEFVQSENNTEVDESNDEENESNSNNNVDGLALNKDNEFISFKDYEKNNNNVINSNDKKGDSKNPLLQFDFGSESVDSNAEKFEESDEVSATDWESYSREKKQALIDFVNDYKTEDELTPTEQNYIHAPYQPKFDPQNRMDIHFIPDNEEYEGAFNADPFERPNIIDYNYMSEEGFMDFGQNRKSSQFYVSKLDRYRLPYLNFKNQNGILLPNMNIKEDTDSESDLGSYTGAMHHPYEQEFREGSGDRDCDPMSLLEEENIDPIFGIPAFFNEIKPEHLDVPFYGVHRHPFDFTTEFQYLNKPKQIISEEFNVDRIVENGDGVLLHINLDSNFSLTYDREDIKGSSMLAKMVEDGLSPNANIFSALIHGFGRGGNINAVFRTIDELNHSGIGINSNTFNRIIEAFARNLEYDSVESALKQKPNSLVLTPDTIKSLLYCYAHKKDWKKVNEYKKMLNSSKDYENNPEFENGSLYSNAYQKNYDSINNAFENESLSFEAYDAIISGFKDIDDNESVVKFYNRLLDNGLNPSEHIMNYAFESFYKVGDLEGLIKCMWQLYRSDYNVITEERSSQLIDLLCKNDHVDSAIDILQYYTSHTFLLKPGNFIPILKQLLKREGNNIDVIENLSKEYIWPSYIALSMMYGKESRKRNEILPITLKNEGFEITENILDSCAYYYLKKNDSENLGELYVYSHKTDIPKSFRFYVFSLLCASRNNIAVFSAMINEIHEKNIKLDNIYMTAKSYLSPSTYQEFRENIKRYTHIELDCYKPPVGEPVSPAMFHYESEYDTESFEANFNSLF